MENYKQGFGADQLFLLVMFFVIGILFIVFAYAYTQMSQTGNATIDKHMGYAKVATLSLDFVAPFFIIGTGLALVASAFLIRSNPIFFIVLYVLQIFFAIVAISMSNAWDSVFTGSLLSSTANQFTMWSFFMKNAPIVSLVLGTIFAIAIYLKGGD